MDFRDYNFIAEYFSVMKDTIYLSNSIDMHIIIQRSCATEEYILILCDCLCSTSSENGVSRINVVECTHGVLYAKII